MDMELQWESSCHQVPFHERSCDCLTPAAQCMFQYWENFTWAQREAMRDRCGREQFPFGVYMHYLDERKCPFAEAFEQYWEQELTTKWENDLEDDCDYTVADDVVKHYKIGIFGDRTICVKTPGWVGKDDEGTQLNYTETVLKGGLRDGYGGELYQMYFNISSDTEAGVNYHFSAPGSSTSGKTEPGDSMLLCPKPVNADYADGCSSDDWRVTPSSKLVGNPGKFKLHISNRNYLFSAHVNILFTVECYSRSIVPSDTNRKCFCTNGTVNWGFQDGTSFFATNGCKIGGCSDGDSIGPCCKDGSRPSSYKGCGLNCFDCEGGCPNEQYD